ncbi:MAG: hypothetical protein OEW25_07925, partial [Nitrospira sp.]|nr:hypothetical protein [Nitrospira sp.]
MLSDAGADSPAWLAPLRSALDQDRARACLTGLHGSTPACALTLLTQTLTGPSTRSRPWVVLTPDDASAERIFNDLQFFHGLMGLPLDRLALFPEWETLPYEETAPHVGLIARRMTTLHRLLTGSSLVLVTSVTAAMHRLIPRSTFEEAVLRFKTGGVCEREPFLTGLLRLGYRRVSVVEIPGEFSVRGGIVDIFSTAYADPIRLEFLGDQVESIRLFDSSTQTSIETLREGVVLPAREFLRPADAPDTLAPIPPDAEWRSPDLYAQMDQLFDYLPAPPCLVLDQPEALKMACKTAWEKIDDGYLRHVDRDASQPYPTPERLFLQWNELERTSASWPALALEPLAAPDDSWTPILSFAGQTPAAIGLGLR